ncbi:PilZ domain-containing protein [Ferrimonas balearica]|uniref:PilZ domain-containing protein n=1 Tax=Ferrimonas balearica TaxID=44012 RepID=UPI001C9951DD|nr:PilZ domain-containing protein [Ferrimonas balearica]MBY5991961.1 PilZ domain-containing protein [Ferrimonas balearica]
MSDQPTELELEEKNRREHPRFTLREDPSQPLPLACDGISARLVRRHWLRDKVLGPGSMKDVSEGGCGLLSAAPMSLGDSVHLELGGLSLPCRVVRKSAINGALHFYGLRWEQVEQEQLLELFAAISRLKKR